MKASTIKWPSCQRGASLVMSLIILVVLMLLGVSALMVSNTQSKLAGNLQFQMLASSAAESALAQAENWLAQPANTASLVAFGTVAGLYAKGSNVNPLTMTWNDTNSIKTDSAGNQRYIIELYAENRVLPGNSGATCGYAMPGSCPNVNLYQATARGVSQLGASKHVQSLFALRTGG